MNKSTIKRVEKLEKSFKQSNYLPVVFVDDEKDIESISRGIGPDTVIIIDDIPDEEVV